MNKLIDLLVIESNQIELSFKKASIEGNGTSQEIAERREESFVREFVSKYFPFPYRVVKGNIIDSYNRTSNSIDCIIISPSHPYTIDVTHGAASVILADGVDFAIEVKPNIVDFGELKRGLKQIQSVKKLRRQRTSFIGNKVKGNKDVVIDTIFQIPTFIFATEGPKNIKEFIEKIYKFYNDESIPLVEQFDYIVINNNCIIINSHPKGYSYINNTDGICFAMTNEHTLSVFLYELNRLPKSELQISKSIINYYINPQDLFEGYYTFNDLNAIYRQILWWLRLTP